MEANGNCRTHTGRNRRWAAPRKTSTSAALIIGSTNRRAEQRRNGMSTITTDTGGTAKSSVTSSFGAELIVRHRQFIDA
jgi:hypothetical protein